MPTLDLNGNYGPIDANGNYVPTVSFAYRDADSSALATDATLNDDTQLVIANVGVGVYEVGTVLRFAGSGGATDAKYTLAFTGTATGMFVTDSVSGALTINGPLGVDFGTEVVVGTFAGITYGAVARGLLIVSAAGTLKVQWAQNTSSAETLVLKLGSHLKIQKVA